MSASDPGQLNQRNLRRRFDRSAVAFDGADFVHRHSFDGLLERIQPMTLAPRRIVDLGCAAGAGSRVLEKRYRRARVIGIDTSSRMLQALRRSRGWFSRIDSICADAAALPIPSSSIDMVISNMLLPWTAQPEAILVEANRVLRTDGLFAFASLGPASFGDLREAWSGIDEFAHVNPFADMHNIGDALVRAGLRDPVLDVDELSVTYEDVDRLFADLAAAGARNALAARNPALTGKSTFARFREALEARRRDGVIELRLELVYGHAWGGDVPQSPGEFHLSPGSIGRRRR